MNILATPNEEISGMLHYETYILKYVPHCNNDK